MEDEIVDAPPAKKKGGKGKLIVVALIVLVMGGAGVTGGLYAAGAFGEAEKKVEEDPMKPRLVLKGEDAVAIAEQFTGGGEGGHGEGGSGEAAHAEPGKAKPHRAIDLPTPKDTSPYQATYFQMPSPYTSNLADTDSLVQIALAISTYYDARVIEAVKTHEMAIRSEVLLLLAQEREFDIATPQGKEELQRKLTLLVNKVLKEKSGYSGVDNVYFTNFVIQ